MELNELLKQISGVSTHMASTTGMSPGDSSVVQWQQHTYTNLHSVYLLSMIFFSFLLISFACGVTLCSEYHSSCIKHFLQWHTMLPCVLKILKLQTNFSIVTWKDKWSTYNSSANNHWIFLVMPNGPMKQQHNSCNRVRTCSILKVLQSHSNLRTRLYSSQKSSMNLYQWGQQEILFSRNQIFHKKMTKWNFNTQLSNIYLFSLKMTQKLVNYTEMY